MSITTIPGKANLPIREIAKIAHDNFFKEKHPLSKHIWGANKAISNTPADQKYYYLWYPISICPGRQPLKLDEFIIGFDIARRGPRKKCSGLFISIVFSKYKKNRHYFEDFKNAYLTKDMLSINYKAGIWDEHPRIYIELKEYASGSGFNYEKCSQEQIHEEAELLFINLKKMYDNWIDAIKEFIENKEIEEVLC